MSERFFRKIRVAIAAGPLHSGSAERPDLAAGRFFDRGMDAEERVRLFMERASSCGSTAHRAASTSELVGIIRSIVPAGSTVLIDPAAASAPELMGELGNGYSVLSLDGADDAAVFGAVAVVTGVDFAIAETGSVVVSSRQSRPRLASTVAAIHIALVRVGQIAADLMDLPEAFGDCAAGGVTIISGPSKTADIEMNLVIGVHGPGQMHLVVVPE